MDKILIPSTRLRSCIPWTHVPGREPREGGRQEAQAGVEGSVLGQEGVLETHSVSGEGLLARGHGRVLQPPAVGPARARGSLFLLRGQVAQVPGGPLGQGRFWVMDSAGMR